MSDIGLIASVMIEPSRRYDITVTVDSDGGQPPNPIEFAVAAHRAASARTANIVTTYAADQIISVVTIQFGILDQETTSPTPVRHSRFASTRSPHDLHTISTRSALFGT